MFEALLSLPTWALIVLLAAAGALVHWVTRTRIVKSVAARRIDMEAAAWAPVMEANGWVGGIERSLSVNDIDLKYADPDDTSATMSVYGMNGQGAFAFYGLDTRVRFEIDLDEAREEGVLEALRPTRHVACLAHLLTSRGEQALVELGEVFAARAGAQLEMEHGLGLSWSIPWELREDAKVSMVTDHASLFEHITALEAALSAPEPSVFEDRELAALAKWRGEVAATLAARALLISSPSSQPARALREEWLKAGASDARVARLIGCVFDPDVLARHGVSRAEHVARIRHTITRCDEWLGPALARRAIEAYGVEDVVGQGLGLDPEEDEGSGRENLSQCVERDEHIFACHVIASFCGGHDAEAFEDAYARVVGHVLEDFETTLEFSEVVGDLEDWHPELVRRALGHACLDEVYTHWAPGLEDAWNEDLARALVGVLEDEGLRAGGLLAITSAATRQRAFRLLAPARVAMTRIGEHWSSNDAHRKEMTEAIGALEVLAAEMSSQGGGLLTLSVDGPAGGLEVSRAVAAGGLEAADRGVTLDLPGEDEGEDAGVEEDADERVEW